MKFLCFLLLPLLAAHAFVVRAPATRSVVLSSSKQDNPVSQSVDELTKSFKNLDTSNFNLDEIQKNANAIVKNISQGELGQRGEVYVVAQVVLGLCILLGDVPFLGGVLGIVLGPGLLLAGLAFVVVGVQQLGPALSPWAKTVSDQPLQTTGPVFGQVRHPIYAGLLAMCAGFSILTGSATRLLLTAILAYVLELKTEYEEDDLIQNFATEYPAYQDAVPTKFVPLALIQALPWSQPQDE